MKSKRNFSFGQVKNTDPSCYIHHENIDISTKFPTLLRIHESNDIKLLDIPQLQIETEKVMSIVGYRMLNIKSLIDGNPMKAANGLLNNANKSSQYLQFFSLPNEQNQKKIETTVCDELVAKSDPLKPLTLIIAQKQSSQKKTCQSSNKKRKITDETSESESKRKKLLQVNEKSDKKIKPNYEIPNKFWELMEPYCAEINDEHVKTLENYIGSYDNDAKYYDVPCLDFANDESFSENNDQNMTPSILNASPLVGDHHLNGFADKMGDVALSNLLKNIDNDIRKPLSQTKTLKGFPQTLVGKICEESEELIAGHKLSLKNLNNDSSSAATCPSKTLAKQLKVSNTYKVEKYVKKSLDELGLFNVSLPFIRQLEPQFDLCNTADDDDGIAKSSEAEIIIIDATMRDGNENSNNKNKKTKNEKNNEARNKDNLDNVGEDNRAILGLHRRQAELKLVSESNMGMLRRLLVAAKRDMKRQDIERRLAVADADVLDSYNVIENYRLTRRQPLKKDRDMAYKAMKERLKVLKELDTFDLDFL